MATCTACGSGKLEEATVTSAAITLTRASTMKKVFSAGNQVLCDVCMDCGVLNRLRGNPGDLAKQLPDE